MIHTKRRMRICTAMLICILAFIWGNSLMCAEVSRAFSDWVKQLLIPLVSEDAVVTQENNLLRKMAHFAEFAALGFCLAWRSGMLAKHPMGSFVLGAAAAAIDETIQVFVPDRGPRIFDVLLDSCGILTGMTLCYFGHTLLKKKQTTTTNMEDTT